KLSFLTVAGSPYLGTATAQVTDGAGQPAQSGLVVNFSGPLAVAYGHDHALSGPGLLNNLSSAPGVYFVDLNQQQSITTCTTDSDGTCLLSFGATVSGEYTVTAVLDSDS